MARKAFALLLLVAMAASCGSETAITTPEERATPGPQLAIGTDPVTGATIETDLDDYYPGQVVHLTGAGWAANETISLVMTEDPDTHADVAQEVVAGADGTFSLDFYEVQTSDLGVTFTLTATGPTSGSVVTVIFTDGNVRFKTGPTIELVASVTYNRYNSSGSCSGTPNQTGQSLSYDTGLGLNSGQSILVTVPVVSGYTYSGYDNGGIAISPASAPSNTTLCVSGYAGGVQRTFTLNYTAVVSNTAPTVNAGGPYTGAEGSAISLGGATGATASDPDAGDVLTYAWTVNTTGIDAGGSCSFSPSNTVLNPSVTCTDDSQGAQGGKFTLTLEVNDGNGHIVTNDADLTVTNANPTANAGEEPYSGTEGAAISLSGSGDDPGNNDDAGLTYEWSVDAAGIGPGGACNLSGTTAQNPTVTCTDDGNFTVSLVVRDDDGGVSTASTVTLTVTNADPTAGAGGPYTGSNEGSAVSLTGTKADAGSNDTHTYAWTWAVQSGVDAGASCSFSDAEALSPTVTCTDDGVFKLTLTVTDDDGGTGSADATLTLGNANPSVTLHSPTDGALFSLLNGAIAVSATYSDAGSNDTHMCRLELDGVLDVIGSYVPVSGGTCAGSILPPEAGVYTLTVRVKDDDDGVGTAAVMVVVYDPSAGFVTGGGWIQSAPGAYKLAYIGGKATFGFVSKYKKGATTPEGNTEFQFHAGGMNFHSSQYQWLVVNQGGTNAQFKGTGTINGLGSYTFMLWATDAPTGDKFRMQITDNNDNGATVYDNGTEQVIASGSIVIHTGGKK